MLQIPPVNVTEHLLMTVIRNDLPHRDDFPGRAAPALEYDDVALGEILRKGPDKRAICPTIRVVVGIFVGKVIGSVSDLLTWVVDRKCEFIAIHEESKDDIMHPD